MAVVLSPAPAEDRPDLLATASCELSEPPARIRLSAAPWTGPGLMTSPATNAPAIKVAIRHRSATCITASFAPADSAGSLLPCGT